MISPAQDRITLHRGDLTAVHDAITAAANEGHTGSMIALVPHTFDADRLALGGPSDEPPEQLHVTMTFLGDATAWDDASRSAVLEYCQRMAAELPPVDADVFGLALFNPTGDEPCWVGTCGGDALDMAHESIAAIQSEPYADKIPEQHSPWVPHLTLTYDVGDSPELNDELLTRCGPVTFDCIRVAFGDQVTDVPMTGTGDMVRSAHNQEDTMPWHVVQNHADCPASRPWGVVKDADGTVQGCHDTQESANSQLAALNAAETTNDHAVNGDARVNGARSFVNGRFQDVAPVDTPSTPVEPMPSEVPPPDAPPTSMIYFEGSFDVHGESGAECARLVGENFLRGVSVSLDDVTDNDVELIWPAEQGMQDEEPSIEDLLAEPELAIFQHGRIVDITCTPQPALQEAYIEADPNDPTRFRGVAAVEGKPTGDGRMFADGSLVWRDPPIALMWQKQTAEAHDDSVLTGRVEMLARKPYEPRANADGTPAAEQPAAAPGQAAASLESRDFGAVATHDTATSDGAWDGAAAEGRLPSPMPLDVAQGMYAWIDDAQVTDGNVPKTACKFPHHEVGGDGSPGAANLTACSAVIGALNGGRGGADVPSGDRQGVYNHVAKHLRDANQTPPPMTSLEEIEALSASTYQAPPASWFDNPRLTAPTPLVVSDDGRVYGHLARWGTCHTSFPGTCVTPPREESYDYFTTGEVLCAGGEHVPVGQLTLGTGHAAARFGARPAAEHYDHTGHAVADVTAGSDEHGIWVAGMVRPDAAVGDVHALRASALSGDWRRIGGRLRLVAALCVNVPGFPVPRRRAQMHDGAQVALVAAGILMPPRPSTRAIDRIARTIERDRASRQRERVETLAARVHR